LVEVTSGEVISPGLSMPHSPRCQDGRLWLLESGTGQLVFVDPAAGRRQRVAELPGFARGLALAGPYAFVGLSKIRSASAMDGVPLADRREPLKCRRGGGGLAQAAVSSPCWSSRRPWRRSSTCNSCPDCDSLR